MITDALLNIMLTIVRALWALVPPWDWNFGETINPVAETIWIVNEWAPVTEFTAVFTLVGGLLTASLAIKFLIKIADWIADIIP